MNNLSNKYSSIAIAALKLREEIRPANDQLQQSAPNGIWQLAELIAFELVSASRNSERLVKLLEESQTAESKGAGQ